MSIAIANALLEMHVVGRMLGEGGKVGKTHLGRTQINPDLYRRVGSACNLDLFQKRVPEHPSDSWASILSPPAMHTIVIGNGS